MTERVAKPLVIHRTAYGPTRELMVGCLAALKCFTRLDHLQVKASDQRMNSRGAFAAKKDLPYS